MLPSALSWLVVVLLFAAVASVAVWRRGAPRRGLAVIVALCALPVVALASLSTIGWPSPMVRWLTTPEGDVTIAGMKLDPGRAIYLMIDGPEPRLFRLAWDMELAKQLQDAANAGQQMTGRFAVQREGNEAEDGGEFLLHDPTPSEMKEIVQPPLEVDPRF